MKKIITQVYAVMYQSKEDITLLEKMFITVVTISVLIFVMLFPLIK